MAHMDLLPVRKNILGSTISFLLIFRANNGYKRYMKAVGYDAAVVQCQSIEARGVQLAFTSSASCERSFALVGPSVSGH